MSVNCCICICVHICPSVVTCVIFMDVHMICPILYPCQFISMSLYVLGSVFVSKGFMCPDRGLFIVRIYVSFCLLWSYSCLCVTVSCENVHMVRKVCVRVHVCNHVCMCQFDCPCVLVWISLGRGFCVCRFACSYLPGLCQPASVVSASFCCCVSVDCIKG